MVSGDRVSPTTIRGENRTDAERSAFFSFSFRAFAVARPGAIVRPASPSGPPGGCGLSLDTADLESMHDDWQLAVEDSLRRAGGTGGDPARGRSAGGGTGQAVQDQGRGTRGEWDL